MRCIGTKHHSTKCRDTVFQGQSERLNCLTFASDTKVLCYWLPLYLL